jgi:hypothetical protein
MPLNLKSTEPKQWNSPKSNIAQHYSAAMDSVNFINELVAGQHDDRMTAEEKADAIQRNVDHLKIMVAKDFGRTRTCNPSVMLLHESLNRNPRPRWQA